MVAVSNMVDLTVEDGVAILTVDNPPVNALSSGVRAGLSDGVAQAAADDNVTAIVLICAGRTFIAGADITEFGGKATGPSLHDALEAMENCSKPIVAAIHGTVLGGGLETALVCHYRVSDAKARFGLPEVKLGLLPGAGGTQRLPRVVGVEKALQMVTSGDQIGADEALASGLISEIVTDLPATLSPSRRKLWQKVNHWSASVTKTLRLMRQKPSLNFSVIFAKPLLANLAVSKLQNITFAVSKPQSTATTLMTG